MYGVTASALARLLRCTTSAALPAVIEPPGEDARRGTDGHSFLERWMRAGKDAAHAGLDTVPADWRRTFEKIDLDEILEYISPRALGRQQMHAELAVAYNAATMTGRILGEGTGRDYSTVSDEEIAGTADLVIRDGEGLFVGDYKFGFEAVPVQDNAQLRFLLLALMSAWGYSEGRVGIVTIHDDGRHSIETERLSLLDLLPFNQRLADLPEKVRRVKWAQKQHGELDVRPGDHCRWCPAWLRCPAKTGLVQLAASGTLTKLLDPAWLDGAKKSWDEAIVAATPDQVGQARVASEALVELAEHMKEQVRRAIYRMGEVPHPDGDRVFVWQQSEVEKIDAGKAAPVLQARGIDLFDVAKVEITKKRLEDEVRVRAANAPGAKRGAGKEAWEGIMGELRDVGAVAATPVGKVATKKRGVAA